MEKKVKNYRNNLIIIFICYVLTIFFNLQLFDSSDILHLLYGISMIVLSVLTLYCLTLINKNIILSAKIATIIGPIMTVMNFFEGFNSGNSFIKNFRVSGWFFLIGGILIFNTGRKLKNNSLQ